MSWLALLWSVFSFVGFSEPLLVDLQDWLVSNLWFFSLYFNAGECWCRLVWKCYFKDVYHVSNAQLYLSVQEVMNLCKVMVRLLNIFVCLICYIIFFIEVHNFFFVVLSLHLTSGKGFLQYLPWLLRNLLWLQFISLLPADVLMQVCLQWNLSGTSALDAIYCKIIYTVLLLDATRIYLTCTGE